MKEIARLEQRLIFKERRVFALRDDGVLKVSSSGSGKRQEFLIKVGHLNPEPTHESFSARKMIIGMCVFVALAIFFTWPLIIPETEIDVKLVLLPKGN